MITAPRADLLNLENALCDAVHMADIAATLLEHNLDKATQEKITGKPNTYYIGNVEALLFAAYETQNKITALRDRYLRALTDNQD